MAAVRRGRRERGFILLDVLVTLLIITISFVVFLSSMSVAGQITRKRADHVNTVIEGRNADAKGRAMVYTQAQ